MIELVAVGAVLTGLVAILLGTTLRDPVTLLSLFACLLFVVPSELVVSGLGGFATPALIVGMACGLWWVLGRLHDDPLLDRGVQPVRYALVGILALAGLSLAAAQLRPLTAFEASGGARTLVQLSVVVGVGLLAADGIHDRDRLATLVDRIVLVGAVAASYGILQFAGIDLPVALSTAIPGLSPAKEGGDFARTVFNRPNGPGLHPIEFGVVVAALLPLAIHRLLHRPAASTASRVVPLLLIGAAVPMSLSRSAFLAAASGLAFMFPAWSPRERLQAVVVGTVAVASTVLVPGLAGTLRGLFLGSGTDPSIQARIDRLPRVVELVEEAPLFGRGFGTFTVDSYFLLDNQLYASIIEVGVVGVSLLGAALLVILWTALRTRSPGAAPVDAHLASAVSAAIVALTVAVVTYDAFFYRIHTGYLALLFGLAGALHRLSVVESPTIGGGDPPVPSRGRPARPELRA